MAKILSIGKGYTNTQHWPIAWGNLDCGHQCSVTEHRWSKQAHDESLFFAHVGDTVECEDCARLQRDLNKVKSAITAGIVHHTRMRHGRIYAYKLDSDSPSGFFVVGSVEDHPISQDYFNSLIGTGLTPLSPTER